MATKTKGYENQCQHRAKACDTKFGKWSLCCSGRNICCHAINFVDTETKSKVLLSSRLRGVILDGLANQLSTVIVDISLPSEEDAIKMLLSISDLLTGILLGLL